MEVLPCVEVLAASYRGVRVGEAACPGPGRAQTFVIAVLNPITILNKVPCLLEVEADVLLAAETAATSSVQNLMCGLLRAAGLKAFWGPPCPDRVHPVTGRIVFIQLLAAWASVERLLGRPSFQGSLAGHRLIPFALGFRPLAGSPRPLFDWAPSRSR